MEKSERKIVAIVGPTASGKTGIGVKLAKELSGEIISADSRQVYRGLDLGTGKEGVPNQEWIANYTDGENLKSQQFNNSTTRLPDGQVQQLSMHRRWIDGVPQWMIDVIEPGERFTLFDYLPLARKAIEEVFSRNKLPIIVGGTGLYVQALVEGFQLQETRNKKQETNKSQYSNIKSQKSVIPAKAGIQANYQIDSGSQATGRNDMYDREQLNNLTIEQLNNLLKELAPELLETIDINNPHRLIRAIERAQEGNIPTKSKPNFEVLQIGVAWPKEVLDSRIDKRIEDRFEQGMLEEIIGLINAGIGPDWLMGLGLEYREITSFLIHNSQFTIHNKISNAQIPMLKNGNEFLDMKDQLKLRSHQYAKRQMTWLKRFPEIVWENDYDKISKTTKKFLK